jgi:hypothetical protein
MKDISREADKGGLWAPDTSFTDNMRWDLPPLIYDSLVRMYDRYEAVTPKPNSFEIFFSMIIIDGLQIRANQLKILEQKILSGK